MAKILVIDNEQHILSLYAKELREAGYEVITALNSVDGLSLFQQESPDLVVMDMRIPQVEGIRRISKIVSANLDTPIVFTSTYCADHDALPWPAAAYVEKQSDLSLLMREINDLLQSRDRQANHKHLIPEDYGVHPAAVLGSPHGSKA